MLLLTKPGEESLAKIGLYEIQLVDPTDLLDPPQVSQHEYLPPPLTLALSNSCPSMGVGLGRVRACSRRDKSE